MLSAYYCWRPMIDGYECLQLLEQNGGFGNNGAQPPMQIHNVHNNAGERTTLRSPNSTLMTDCGWMGFKLYGLTQWEGGRSSYIVDRISDFKRNF